MRRLTRLKSFDYRAAGAYFITICTFGRECLLGQIVHDRPVLSDIGRVVTKAWLAIPAHFFDVSLGDFVVMPNHVHGILVLRDVGAKHASPLHLPPRGTSPGSLAAILQSFKSAASRGVNQQQGTPGRKLWQRGFYDHVIRDDEELNRLRRCIEDNLLRWALDEENPSKVKP